MNVVTGDLYAFKAGRRWKELLRVSGLLPGMKNVCALNLVVH